MTTVYTSVRRCGTAILSLLLLVVLAAFGGCKKDDSGPGGGGGSGGDGYPSVEGCPRFPTTSNDEVTLRYKFMPGQKVGFNFDMDSITEIAGSKPEQRMTVSMNMTMSGDYEIQSVDANGDFRASMVIGRVTMKAKARKEVSFDSDKDGSGGNPAFRPLMAMLKVPIAVKVSPVGKLLETDIQPLLEAVRRAQGGALADNVKDSAEELVKSAFVQLSEKPIKAGDIYDAGEIVTAMPGAGEMKAKVRYKLVAVSGDRKQAILQPKAEVVFNSQPGAKEKYKLDASSMDGWILFDIEKGKGVRSAWDMKTRMTTDVKGQKGRMDITMKMRFNTSDK